MKTGVVSFLMIMKRILVLINPKSGLPKSFLSIRQALDKHWDVEGNDLVYQFTQNKEDGIAKAERAVTAGYDTVLVSGGDGTVSTIGRVLVNTNVTMGVIPTGSGNGFARHFGIPLNQRKAVEVLAKASVRKIDVGIVDNIPFFVTCSMAWDAAIVRHFDKSPVRGIIPYLLAGVQGFLGYRPENMEVEIHDPSEILELRKPIIFTIANLTQYGGGAKIAPDAKEDDGYLELVVGLQKDAHILIANLGRLFDGSLNRIPRLITRSFKSLSVKRNSSAPIQIDGELVDVPEEINVGVIPGGLRVLVPS